MRTRAFATFPNRKSSKCGLKSIDLDKTHKIYLVNSKNYCTFAPDSKDSGMENLIGRQFELAELQRALDSKRSEFVILYGRRRVGKTFLVRCFCNDTYSFHFVGAHKQPLQAQLTNFREALQRCNPDVDVPELTNWHEAFRQLANYLEQCQEARKVVFFDEMPWIDTQKSDFVSELEYFWSGWVQNRDDIVFIACGSATTWMKEKLEDNQGGLHNRITHRIYLRPFYLNECKQYLLSHGFSWDDYQILQFYMIFGGVPYYLSLLRPLSQCAVSPRIRLAHLYPRLFLTDNLHSGLEEIQEHILHPLFRRKLERRKEETRLERLDHHERNYKCLGTN